MLFKKIFLTLGLIFISTISFAQNDSTTTTTVTADNDLQKTMAANAAAGQLFMEANKKKTGVVTLADGLQYKVIKQGTGVRPTINDVVMVDYTGTLVNGTEFDSSYKRGQPAVFPVRGVIAGWTEALQLMPVGSTWEIYLPPNLAYGEQGAPPNIGPNETLIFRVTLIDIKKP